MGFFWFIPRHRAPAEEKGEKTEMCGVASSIWILPYLPFITTEYWLLQEDLERNALGYCSPFQRMLFCALSFQFFLLLLLFINCTSGH